MTESTLLDDNNCITKRLTEGTKLLKHYKEDSK